jgi:hypothetical protein
MFFETFWGSPEESTLHRPRREKRKIHRGQYNCFPKLRLVMATTTIIIIMSLDGVVIEKDWVGNWIY